MHGQMHVVSHALSNNGLQLLSQVMVDKLSALSRSKVSEPFGRLDDDLIRAVDRALLLVVGLI